MTLIRRAGRFAGMSVVASILLAGCDKGPDRTQVAADLQKSVEGYLAQIEGADRVVSHSAVKVTPQQDTGYLVAIDGLKAGGLEIGGVSYVLTPKDDKTFEASKLTLANDMPIKGADGKQIGDVKLTNKAFSGIWQREAQSFTKFDLQLADIAIDDSQQGNAVKIAGANMNIDGVDKGQGVWDQTGKFTLTNIDVTNPTDGHLTVKEVDATSAIQALKLVEYATKVRAMRDAMTKAKAAQPAASADASAANGAATGTTTTGDAAAQGTAPAGQPDPAEAAFRDFANALPGLFAGFNTDFHVSGISYQAADQSGAFDLGKAGITFSASGFDQPKTSIKFTIDHDALAVRAPEAQNELLQALIPANGALVISLNNLPTKDVAEVVADMAPMIAHPEAAGAEAQSAVLAAKVQQLLQQDGVTLKIEPSHLTSAATNLDTTGDFAIQAAAAHGATGSIDIAITGLDQVIALGQKQAEQDPEAAQYVGMAQALLTYANREQNSAGKAVDKFKIDVPQSGQLTVNGKPLPF